MGFRFRKSIKLGGGFRVNLSKSGIGYSWGVPGYRITRTANGRTRKTYSIPGTGISYVDESRKRSKCSHKSNSESIEHNIVYNDLTEINSAEIENYNSVKYQKFIKQISRRLKLKKLSNCLLWSLLLIANPVFLTLFLIGVSIKIYLHTCGKIKIIYDFDEYMHKKYITYLEAWMSLNNNKGLWQVIQIGTISNKRAISGALKSAKTININILKQTPFYFRTNINVVQIKLKNEDLIILPDKIIIVRGTKVGVIDYEDINIEVSSINMVEPNQVPSDAKIIDYTWLHVNKNGTPDKRFKNNPQLPICLYGNISIKSTNGLHVELQCSNVEIVNKFEKMISSL